jgi:exosortase
MLTAAYLPVFSLYARQHWSTDNQQGAYTHAPLAVLLIGYLFWQQRTRLLAPMPEQPASRGLLLLGTGVALKIYGEIQGYVVLQGMSLIPVLLGLLHCYYATNTVRLLKFPIFFLLFIIPLPVAAIDALTLPLIKATAELVTNILPLFNIEVVKNGHVLTINVMGLSNRHEIILAPECSGIRSLVSLLALSCVFAHLRGRRVWHATTIMLMTIPLIILTNSIRVTLTVLMIVYSVPDAAQSQLHFVSGLLLFTIILPGLFVLDVTLERCTNWRRSASG